MFNQQVESQIIVYYHNLFNQNMMKYNFGGCFSILLSLCDYFDLKKLREQIVKSFCSKGCHNIFTTQYTINTIIDVNNVTNLKNGDREDHKKNSELLLEVAKSQNKLQNFLLKILKEEKVKKYNFNLLGMNNQVDQVFNNAGIM